MTGFNHAENRELVLAALEVGDLEGADRLLEQRQAYHLAAAKEAEGLRRLYSGQARKGDRS